MSPVSEPVKVGILLAVHQGAAYLCDQLDSFVAQDAVDWALVVSDDSPSPDDGSGALLCDFQAAHPAHEVTLRRGPSAGFAANFLTLLRDAPAVLPRDASFAALSDQDDVWLPDKLLRAVTALQAVPNDTPALYCARTMIVDAELHRIGPSPAFVRPPAFENALVQSIGGGNTMVLNRAAMNLVSSMAQEVLNGPGAVVAHDWWLYQVITGCGGRVLRDETPTLLYRQHGENQIGANRSPIDRVGRAVAVICGRLRNWNRINMAALDVSAHRFRPEARQTLGHYQAAQSGPLWRRLAALRASGVWRQGRVDTLALYLACALRRL